METASAAAAPVGDPDGLVVTDVPVGPNELPIGTLLSGTLQQPISTKTTQPGTRFTATLSADVSRNGVVFLPAGSTVYGRISRIHGGRRISGPSAIRLQPTSVSLPDGTVYPITADVTDLDHYASSHVNEEGTIVGNTHPAQTAAAIGLTTGSAVVAGALIGGGVGAVVGLGVGAGVATDLVAQARPPAGTAQRHIDCFHPQHPSAIGSNRTLIPSPFHLKTEGPRNTEGLCLCRYIHRRLSRRR